ncbi:MAG: hypothetical protein R3234_09715 [Thermoanaerobaculia bacterium]|nr:hypothetical protein [Thermoanaerobaculia bacterium]
MTPAGWLTAVAVCGFVWGGFLLLLIRALRAERSKRSARDEDS